MRTRPRSASRPCASRSISPPTQSPIDGNETPDESRPMSAPRSPRSNDNLLTTLGRARRFLLWRAVEQAGLALVVGAIVLALVTLWIALATPLHRDGFALIRLGLLGGGALLLLAAAARVALAPARLEDAALATGRQIGRASCR